MDTYGQAEDREVSKNVLVEKNANRIVLIQMVLETRINPELSFWSIMPSK